MAKKYNNTNIPPANNGKSTITMGNVAYYYEGLENRKNRRQALNPPIEPGSEGASWRDAYPIINTPKQLAKLGIKYTPDGYVLNDTYSQPKNKSKQFTSIGEMYNAARLFNDTYTRAHEAYNKKLEEYAEKKRLFANKEGAAWDKYNQRVQQQVDNYFKQEEIRKYKEARDRLLSKNKEYNKQEREDHARKQRELNKAFGRSNQDWNGVNYAGYSPWDPRYGEFKKLNKKQLSSIGADYKKIKKPDKKIVHLANGTTAEVIDSELGVPLGFSKLSGYRGPSATVTETITRGSKPQEITSLEYAEHAFDGKHKTYKHDGCGHIKEIEYSAYYQLLKVTFINGTISIYYRVPKTVASELLYFAENGQTSTNTFDGSERHVLGIRFWDLIRIRGTLHGSRYRFEYMDYVESNGGTTTSYILADVPKLPVGRNSSKLSSDVIDAVNNARNSNIKNSNEVIRKILTDNIIAQGRESVDNLSDADNTTIKLSKSYIASDVYPGEYSIDDIDNYFDSTYNKDLGYSNVNRKLLQDAYNMYNDMNIDMSDNNIAKIAKLILKANGNLSSEI